MSRVLVALSCCLAVAGRAATIRTTPLQCDGVVHAVAGEQTRSAALHGQAEIDLTGSKQWRMTLDSPDCWAAPVITADDPVVIPVWPKRSLSGEFSVAPPSVTVRIESPDGTPGGVPPSEEGCEVDGKRWKCGVPRVPLDVRLEIPGFAPVRLWSIDAADAGKIELHPGASVAGFVTRDDRGSLSDAAVELTTEGKAIQRAKANARGFFQFTGVPPGTYDIAARRPNGAPTHDRGLRVVADHETALRRPLLLAGFATIRATLRPPVTPASHPWTVVLQRVDFARSAWLPVARGAATAAGIWEYGQLERETYNLQVVDELGAVYSQQYVELNADAKEITVLLSTVPVEGRIRLGGQPLHASIRFETGDANVSMESNDDGTFYGSLPHEGRYELRIQPKRAGFQELRRRVAVERPSAGGVASVNIDLPNGRIKGVVIDGKSKPLPRASILVLRGKNDLASALSDETGTFEIIGLEPGSATLVGVHGKNRSMPVSYEIAAEPQVLTMTINDARIVRGRVLSSGGGGIAGALLRYVDGMWGNKTVSGPGGEFSFPVTSTEPSTTVVVVVPGFPVKLVKLGIPDAGEGVDVVVSSVSGTLSIIPSPPGQWPVVFHDGCFISLSQLLMPRTAPGPPPEVRGDRFVIEVEPGEYAVCASAALGEQCARRVVPPRGDAFVDMRSR